MNVKLLVAGAGLLSAALAFGDDLIVNAPTTLSSTADYHNAEIHANLTVDSAASVAVTGDVVTVGSEVGESPVISISGRASFITQHLKPNGTGGDASHWLWPSVNIGENGGSARFVVSDSAHMSHTSAERPTTGIGLWFGGVNVMENAAVNNVEDDTVDLLELQENGYADFACLSNFNAKTVRILFNGGKLRLHYAGIRGSVFCSCATGKTLELRSVEGKDIYLYKVYYAPYLVRGGGTLKTSGDGDFVIYEEGYVEGSNKVKFPLGDDSICKFDWGHKGDFRLEQGGVLQPRADDRLPYGEGTGIVRLNGVNASIYPEIDLNGTSQKMNGLVTTAAAFVSNRVAKAASVVLGFGDYEGAVLNARIFGNVTVVKEGSAGLSVKSTVAPALNVTSGTVTFGEGDSDFGVVTVAPGAKLVIDGVTLTCRSCAAADEDVSCINGGKIVLQVGSTGAENHDWDILGGTGSAVEKIGSNVEVVHPKTSVQGGIHVAGGSLVLSGRAYCTNEWWRLTLKRPYVNNYAQLVLSEWALYQYAMPEDATLNYYNYRAMGNVTYSAQNVDPKDLKNSEVTISNGPAPDGWKWTEDPTVGKEYLGPAGLFDSKSYGGLLVTNGNFGTTETDPSRWVILTLRIKANQPVGVYSLSSHTSMNYVRPKAWSLETSPDGETWTMADEHSMPATPDANEFSNGFWNYGKPYSFTQLTMDRAAGVSPTADVRVDAGAVLDLSHVLTDNVVGSLTVDALTGGGTIVNFVPAATGVLNLVNATAEDTKGLFSVPMTLLNAKSLENFAGWTVTVNGKAKPNWGVSYADGAFHFSKPGMTVIVR